MIRKRCADEPALLALQVGRSRPTRASIETVGPGRGRSVSSLG